MARRRRRTRGDALAGDPAAVPSVRPGALPASGPAPIRVAIVEDHPAVRAGLSVVLTQMGMAVVGAETDARHVLEMVHREHPDIVLLDVSLPYISGPAATRLLRVEFPCLPIIAMSVYEQEDEIVRHMLDAGASTFISKFALDQSLEKTIRFYVEAVRRERDSG